MAIVLLDPARELHSTRCGSLTQPRWGVMLHFDGSSEDSGAVEWFTEDACNVSYNRLYLDNGDVVEICGLDKRAWHAGVCRRTPEARDANSAFYGLSAATNERNVVTEAQRASIIQDTAALFGKHGWKANEAMRRIVGHNTWATFPADYPDIDKRGRLGRKVDPEGLNLKEPILSVAEVRAAVVQLLSLPEPS